MIYLGFVSLGLPDGTLGVAWPAMFPELQLPVGLAGVITIVVTLLSGVSGFMSGRIIARWRTGPVVLVSCVLTGSALLAISQASGLAWLLAAAVPLGIGAGAVDAGLNGYVARHYSGRHMNWLHACWGVGATCGPLVMGAAVSASQGWRGGYLVLGCAQLGLAAVFLVTLRWWDRVPERTEAASLTHPETAAQTPTLGADSFAGWLSPALFALYAAIEATTGLWAATLLIVGRGFSPATAAACTAGYYGAITGGRVLVGFVVDRWGNRRLVTGGALVALVGAIVWTIGESPIAAAAGLGLVGLGFAPVYPCLMHEVPRRFAPDAALVVIGRQSGAAYLGVAVLPAVAGVIAQHALPAVPWVVIGGIVVLIAGVRRLDRMT